SPPKPPRGRRVAPEGGRQAPHAAHRLQRLQKRAILPGAEISRGAPAPRGSREDPLKLTSHRVLDRLPAEEPCLGAVFTSYGFDPNFFENHVLRAVLRLRSDPVEH